MRAEVGEHPSVRTLQDVARRGNPTVPPESGSHDAVCLAELERRERQVSAPPLPAKIEARTRRMPGRYRPGTARELVAEGHEFIVCRPHRGALASRPLVPVRRTVVARYLEAWYSAFAWDLASLAACTAAE